MGVLAVVLVALSVYLLRGSALPSDLATCRTPIEREINSKLVKLYLANGDAKLEGIVLGVDLGGEYWYADVKLSERKFRQSCRVPGKVRSLAKVEFESYQTRSSYTVVDLR
jgi:hypothetical protein